MINELQKKIDEINYWDLLVLDIQSKYFGDEVYIYIEKMRRFVGSYHLLPAIKFPMRPMQNGVEISKLEIQGRNQAIMLKTFR